MLRITIDRPAMLAGDPCFQVADHGPHGAGPITQRLPLSGFECRGVVIVKAEGGHSWIEHHGDDDWLAEGGLAIGPTDELEQVPVFNWFPAGQLDRLDADETLTFVAVHRNRVLAGRTPAVTVYGHTGRLLLARMVEAVRLEGVVRSVTVGPPIQGPGEPLNVWLETHGAVEIL